MEIISKECWFTVCGQKRDALASSVENAVARAQTASQLSSDEVERVKQLDFSVCKGELNVSDEILEKLRRMCQIWDVDIRVREISSHRKFIGPVIVAAKKLVFPVLRAFLNDTLRQQRDFNAAAIQLVGEIVAERGKGAGKL